MSTRATDVWGDVVARPRDVARGFDYVLPTRIVAGDGATGQLGSLLAARGLTRPLVITDPGVRAAGLVDRVAGVLRDAGVGGEVYDGVRSDPPTWQAEEVARQLRSNGHDGVIGLGGGSALDTAKAAAALATNGGEARDYVGREWLTHDPLPIFAVPTTAGTGSEVTMWSVLTDADTGAKVSIGSTRIMPAVALLDPELTLGLPPRITAMTGMDALSHAVESYGSVWNHPIAEGLALRAIESIGASLPRAVEQGNDLGARRAMLQASMVAELAANSTRLGLCHALALPLGARHHVPHGLANALLLAPVVAFNAAAAPDRYARIGDTLGGDDAAAIIRGLNERVGTAGRLTDWGVGEADLEPLAQMALKSDNVLANPRQADADTLVAILRGVL